MWRHCSKKKKSHLCWRNTTSGKLGGCSRNEERPEEETPPNLSRHFDQSKRSWRLSSSTYICFADRPPPFRPLSPSLTGWGFSCALLGYLGVGWF